MAVWTRSGIKSGIQREIGIQAGDAVARDSVHGDEISADEPFAVVLPREGIDAAIREHVRIRIIRAIGLHKGERGAVVARAARSTGEVKLEGACDEHATVRQRVKRGDLPARGEVPERGHAVMRHGAHELEDRRGRRGAESVGHGECVGAGIGRESTGEGQRGRRGTADTAAIGHDDAITPPNIRRGCLRIHLRTERGVLARVDRRGDGRRIHHGCSEYINMRHSRSERGAADDLNGVIRVIGRGGVAERQNGRSGSGDVSAIAQRRAVFEPLEGQTAAKGAHTEISGVSRRDTGGGWLRDDAGRERIAIESGHTRGGDAVDGGKQPRDPNRAIRTHREHARIRVRSGADGEGAVTIAGNRERIRAEQAEDTARARGAGACRENFATWSLRDLINLIRACDVGDLRSGAGKLRQRDGTAHGEQHTSIREHEQVIRRGGDTERARVGRITRAVHVQAAEARGGRTGERGEKAGDDEFVICLHRDSEHGVVHGRCVARIDRPGGAEACEVGRSAEVNAAKRVEREVIDLHRRDGAAECSGEGVIDGAIGIQTAHAAGEGARDQNFAIRLLRHRRDVRAGRVGVAGIRTAVRLHADEVRLRHIRDGVRRE